MNRQASHSRVPNASWPRPSITCVGMLMLVPLAAACHSTGQPISTANTFALSYASNEEGLPKRRVLTQSEIARTTLVNAFDAIVRLRPEYLGYHWAKQDSLDAPTRRADTSDRQTPTVFIDGYRWGGLIVLRSIPARGIREIRYYHGAEVPIRYGPGVSAVIDVLTQR